MADFVFLCLVHLAEGFGPVVWQKHRIVTEAEVAAWRPHKRTGDKAFEGFGVAVGPRKR